MPSNALPVICGDKDRLLQEAVARLGTSPRPGGVDGDPIVTATRRLPAVAATYSPFPEQTDERLRHALASRSRAPAASARRRREAPKAPPSASAWGWGPTRN